MRHVFVLTLALWGSTLDAQETCTDATCATLLAASAEASFAGGQGLSPDTQADAIAALEQQAFRELRWDVVQAARFALSFEVAPADAAEARVMVSPDGDAFAPLAPDTLVQPGQVVSVLVIQSRREAAEGGAVSFPASEWRFELATTPVPAPQEAVVGPVLIPIAFGDDLGCETPGCGEGGEDGSAPSVVGGTASAGPGEAPATSSGSASGDRDLARTLQAELARVGCYTIAVDGLWGPGSRRAMTAFNTAKGTALIVQSPSAAALATVAKETERVCPE